MSATLVIIAFAVLAGGIQGVIAIRWYDPPPRDGEIPSAVPEAALFTVVFAVLFAGYGFLLGLLAGAAGPFSPYLLGVFALAGVAVSYGVITRRWTAENTVVEQYLAMVSAIVFTAFPLVILAF